MPAKGNLQGAHMEEKSFKMMALLPYSTSHSRSRKHRLQECNSDHNRSMWNLASLENMIVSVLNSNQRLELGEGRGRGGEWETYNLSKRPGKDSAHIHPNSSL